MVNKSEFDQWRKGEIYQELTETIKGNISLAAGELVGRTEPSPHRDQYLRGFVAGLAATLEWQPDFAPDNGDEDEV